MSPQEIRTKILEKIPDGIVVPRHNERGHFYEVVPLGKTFPSVTAKLQVLKDESLMNYKMNRAIEYVFTHFKAFDDNNVTEHLEKAKNVSQLILEDAGGIGTRIHNYREAHFNEWIASGLHSPAADAVYVIPPSETDVRAVSGMRALDKFIKERDYVPVISELFVYDGDLGLAGTLDDVGIMRKDIRKGNDSCEHDIITKENGKIVGGKYGCWKCPYKFTYEFVLMDVKTSNQFKDHYFFQVAIYYMMLVKLTGIKPTRCFILKLSKEDGTYKLEDLRSMGKLVKYAIHMLKTNEALDFIRASRKDNQKNVLVL